jgi:hypothetical protein
VAFGILGPADEDEIVSLGRAAATAGLPTQKLPKGPAPIGKERIPKQQPVDENGVGSFVLDRCLELIEKSPRADREVDLPLELGRASGPDGLSGRGVGHHDTRGKGEEHRGNDKKARTPYPSRA